MKLSCIVPHTSMLLYGLKMLSNLIKSFKFATAQEERRTDIVEMWSMIETGEKIHPGPTRLFGDES